MSSNLTSSATAQKIHEVLTVVAMNIAYEGGLRCIATHTPSATTLITDAPVDNHGKGESFSPTDLVATALGTCMLTLMGIAADALQVDIRGTTLSIEKEMAKQPPRRIAKLTIRIHVPTPLTPDVQQKLIRAAETCPVKYSLHPDIEITTEWRWA